MFAGDNVLTGKIRTITGKKVKNLRKQGIVPANIFGDLEKSKAISLNSREFIKVYQEAGDTSVISLTLDGEKLSRPVLVEEVMINPINQSMLHVSLRQVNLKEKITAEVPIELLGDLVIKEAVAVLLRESIEVEALPNNLPEAFEIDLGKFTEIGQEISVAQLDYDRSKVEIVEEDKGQIVLQIQAAQQMAEVVEEVPEAGVEDGEEEEINKEGEGVVSEDKETKKAE